MKNFYFTFLLLHNLSFLQAQNVLRGKVIDARSGTTLPGATVFLPHLMKGVSTDSAGVYHLQDLPAGRFLVEVKFLGYTPVIRQVVISSSTTEDFSLEPSVTELHAVVITSTSLPVERTMSPVPIAVTDKEATMSHPSSGPIDALAFVPGVSVISTGLSSSKPVIRGLSGNRVLVLFNGIRQEMQQWGDEHGIDMDEESVGQVEIVKGPGSLIYGSDALAGVINFLPPLPPEEGAVKLKAGAGYQTNNGAFRWHVSNQGNINHRHWSLNASRKNAGAYQNRYDGMVYNSGFTEEALSGQAGVTRKWGYSHLLFSYFQKNYGIVEGTRDSSGNFLRLTSSGDSVSLVPVAKTGETGYAIDIPRQKIRHYLAGVSGKFFKGHSHFAYTVALQNNLREEFTDPLTPADAGLRLNLSTGTADLKYSLPEIWKMEMTAGCSGMLQRNSNEGKEYLIPDYSIADGGVYIMTSRSSARTQLVLGGRADYRVMDGKSLYLDSLGEPVAGELPGAKLRFPQLRRYYRNLAGSAGLSYSVRENLIFKTNLASGFRSPTIAELAANGVHEGNFRYEKGNTQLFPERSLQADAGIHFHTEHLELEAGVFRNDIRNFIFLHQQQAMGGGDSTIIQGGESFSVFTFSQGNAVTRGGEITIDIHPHPADWLHFENAFSFAIVDLLNQPDSTTNLPFTPPPKIRSELRANVKKVTSFIRNGFVKLELNYFFAQNKIFWAYGTETATSSYFVLNTAAGGGITGKKQKTILEVHIIAGNILDTPYQSHLSRLKYAPENPSSGRRGIYAMGRDFGFRLTVPFNLR